MMRIPAISAMGQRKMASRPARRPHSRPLRWPWLAALTTIALAAAGCGSSGSSPGPRSPAAHPRFGGTYTILANTNFGVADPAQNYTAQEWQLLIDTHDALVQFKRVGG